MYLIEISSQNGSFFIGPNKKMKLTKIKGIGLPTKSKKTVDFVNVPGITTTSCKDNWRTITIAGDFYGNRNDVKNIYRVIAEECEIKFICGAERKMIRGRCVNPEDIERICLGFYSFAFQFECDSPYFEDIYENKISILNRTDQLPNVYEDGQWYIELPAVATQRTTNVTVTNTGDLPVYPVIIIRNISNGASYENGLLVLSNENVGAITLHHDFSIGETVIIDLPNRIIYSVLENGEKVDITNQISDDTILSSFRLVVGDNQINVQTENTSLDLCAELQYKNLYREAVFL